jgi:pimeloyl-ACP methyl ester carboxylesterase
VSYQFIEKQIYVNEHKIFYLEGGIASNKEPILFIHGWAVSVEPYQEIINVLCQRYQVIAPALPGFGKSEGDVFNWNYNEYATFLIAFLQILNIKKVHLIGHSLGGGVSATLAALEPTVIRSLVLVDSTGIPVEPVPKVLFQRLIEMTAQTPQIRFPQLNQVFQAFFYNALFRAQNTIKMLWLSLTEDLKSLLPQIKSPCLLVWGANDLTTPLIAGKEFSRLIKGSKLVVMKEGYHEWSIFFVEKIADIIFNFIDEVEKSKLVE